MTHNGLRLAEVREFRLLHYQPVMQFDKITYRQLPT